MTPWLRRALNNGVWEDIWGSRGWGLEAGGLEAGGLEAAPTDFGSGHALTCPKETL